MARRAVRRRRMRCGRELCPSSVHRPNRVPIFENEIPTWRLQRDLRSEVKRSVLAMIAPLSALVAGLLGGRRARLRTGRSTRKRRAGRTQERRIVLNDCGAQSLAAGHTTLHSPARQRLRDHSLWLAVS